jgi:hypothetical protein
LASDKKNETKPDKQQLETNIDVFSTGYVMKHGLKQNV